VSTNSKSTWPIRVMCDVVHNSKIWCMFLHELGHRDTCVFQTLENNGFTYSKANMLMGKVNGA
jgi:hypothetical protein